MDWRNPWASPIPTTEESCLEQRNRQVLPDALLPGQLRHHALLRRAGGPLCTFSADRLQDGTLFPGLNLPFHLKVEGSTLPSTPLVELQALEFVVLELGTYLDTHPDDTEAFELFKQYSAMEQSAKAAYEAKFGPITKTSAAAGSSYRWLQDPWPWNYGQNEVK